MDITYISATDLKRKAAEVLNMVYYKKRIAVVERFGKALVKISPVEDEKVEPKDIKTVLNRYFGAASGFPDVKKERKFRKKNVIL